MTTEANGTPATAKPGVEDIEADIARTREELAETVDELTARLDVKSRVQDRIRETRTQAADRVRTIRAQATDDEGRPTPVTLASGGAVLAAVVVLVGLALWRRKGR